MEQRGRTFRRVAGMLAARLPEARLGEVADPRAASGRRWKLGALLDAVVACMCTGARSLAHVEQITASMSPAMRRRLRLSRRVPDTTLRDLLCAMKPEPLRGAIHAVTRAAHRRKAIEPDRLPFGVVAMDGKGTALSGCDDHYAQRQSRADGTQFSSVLRTITCTLVSAQARPCIDAIPLPASTNEMGHFAAALNELVRHYGSIGLFRLVSYDAGACSRENATTVCGHGLHYLFGLKSTQPTLSSEAERLLAGRTADQADAVSEDVVKGNIVTRRIYLTDQMEGFADWEHLRTVLRVESETRTRDGKLLRRDDRYRLSSLPLTSLSAAQWLRVVRLHWGVENNCHHTFDTVFDEDDRPWIEDCPRGALSVLLLRRVAYNLLTLFRALTLRSEERRAMPWAELLRAFAHTLVAATDEQLQALRPRKLAPPSV